MTMSPEQSDSATVARLADRVGTHVSMLLSVIKSGEQLTETEEAVVRHDVTALRCAIGRSSS